MDHSSRHAAGDRVHDRYELESLLGTGSFGEVWLARDHARSQENVALKLLHAHHDNKRVRARFLLEAELLTKLRHPGIARAFDYAMTDDAAFIAIEYVEGHTLLHHLLSLPGPPTGDALRELMQIFRQTCATVHFAHGDGVIHRDLKPANIMIAPGDGGPRVKVLDFGVAKLLDTPDSEGTTKGRLVGTANYISPEQLTGQAVGHHADVFALGVILFEILTLRRAWLLGGDKKLAAMGARRDDFLNPITSIGARVIRGPRPRVSDYRSDLPPELDALIADALAPLPFERIESSAELWARTARALGPLTRDELDAIPTLSIPSAVTDREDLRAMLTIIRPQELDAPPGLEPAPKAIAEAARPPIRPPDPALLTPAPPRANTATRALIAALIVLNVALLGFVLWPYLTAR